MLIYGMENQSIKLMLIWDTKRPKRPYPSRAYVVNYNTDEVRNTNRKRIRWKNVMIVKKW